jgi:hypothetical protein
MMAEPGQLAENQHRRVASRNLAAITKRGVGSEPASPAIETEPAEQKYHHEDDQ